MSFTPVDLIWNVERRNILPVVFFHGESTSIAAQSLLISQALDFFDQAQKFKGIPYQDPYIYPSNMPLSISFAIIFKTPTDCKSFSIMIQEKLK